MQAFDFNTTKQLICEIGGIKHITRTCAHLEIKKPLIVTDKGIKACGLLAPLMKALKAQYTKTEIVVFDEVQADPSEDIILAICDLANKKCIDGVIGYGGGSSMDAAKVAAVMQKSTQTIDQLYGVDNVTGGRLPLILVPTTAGTGSEVTQIAILTTGETTKAGIVSQQLLPDIAILDAELTCGLPAHVTAATGIDAMVHAIEAYTSKIKKNVYSDMLAKQALSLLSQNIETATFSGSDLPARQNMLLGACLAGQAFANAPVAAVHALAYPLGGHFHIPHGLSNALVLPHVLRFNKDVAAKSYAELTPFVCAKRKVNIHEEHDTSPANQGDDAICDDLIDYIETLITKLALPNKLRILGIQKNDLPMLAQEAMLQTRLLVNNPKTVSENDALAIYESAY